MPKKRDIYISRTQGLVILTHIIQSIFFLPVSKSPSSAILGDFLFPIQLK